MKREGLASITPDQMEIAQQKQKNLSKRDLLSETTVRSYASMRSLTHRDNAARPPTRT